MSEKEKYENFYMEETSYIRKTEVIEEFLDVNDYESENGNLIRMEMNVIEFPMFSKNPKVKKNQALKYYFSKDKNSFLEITPPHNESIPSEFDERVFIALLKVMKKKENKPIFYCSAGEIVDSLNIAKNSRNSMFSKLKPSILKLSKTNYSFFNLFYKSNKGKVDDLINTSLISVRIVTLKDADNDEKYLFTDKRIKEIYRIRIADDIYNNVTNKGYLVFDADVLLNIKDPVVRSLYTQITKWRFNQLYLKRPLIYIAKKIPLSVKGTMLYKTIKKINDSFSELKELGLIFDFRYIENKKKDKSEFEIFFNDGHNKYKQQLFYKEREDFNSNFVHSIEERIICINPEEKDSSFVFEILNIFGPKGATLKTLPNVVKEALSKYEFEFVRDTAEYTAYNAKASLLKYFKEALVNNWADEYISKKKAKENKVAAKKMEVIEEAHIVESTDSKVLNLSWEDFEKLPIESQNKIKDKAYKIYLEETNSSDTKSSRGIFEKTQKALIVKIYNQDIEEPSVIAEPEEKVDNKKVYPSLAKFCTDFYKFAKKTNLEITLEDIISSLKLLEEYEDDVFYASYDLESNTGYYELKK